MLKRSAGKGFTLIELLIVVAIIGILAAIAVPNFLNAQIRAKVSRAQSDLRSLGTAIQMYGLDNNVFPGGEGLWASGMPWWQKHSYRYHQLTTPISYMSSIPIDPFQTNEPQRLNSELGDIWDGAYVYDEARRPGGGKETMELYGPGFQFAARSPGPALNWAGNIAHGNQIVYYTTSNGLISDGIMAYLGPGGTLY